MAVGDQDINTFYRDGDQVTRLNGQPSFMAWFDIPEKIEVGGSLGMKAGEVMARPLLTFASTVNLGHNEQITVRGVTYRVRSVNKVHDGLESQAELSLP